MCHVGAERRHRRSTTNFVVDFGDGLRRAPDPPAGRRLLDGFVLLSVGLTTVVPGPTKPSLAASLWAGVVAIGVYHGLNPAMGWPLAVANGLERQARRGACFATWLPLGAGHLLAMALVLVPFAMLTWMLQWGREMRIGAGAAGAAVRRCRGWCCARHPRWLARVRPTQVALWSFLMATAHGAALMLLPILLGLCESPPAAAGRCSPGFDHAA